jgi:hypothetical protein
LISSCILGRHPEKADSVMKRRAEGLLKDLRDALNVEDEGVKGRIN